MKGDPRTRYHEEKPSSQRGKSVASMAAATTLSMTSCPVVEELLPAPAAWEVARRLAGQRYLLFLDSALSTSSLGRYSFISADPIAWIHSRDKRAWIDDDLQPEGDPFAVLERVIARHRFEAIPGLPPYQGGAAGLFGYDLCHQIERLPRPRFNEFETPDLAVGLYDWVAAFDHVEERAWLISTGLPETDPDRRRRRARQRLDQVRQLLRGSPRSPAKGATAPRSPVSPAAMLALPGHHGVYSSFDRSGFLAAIRHAIEYVHAGDCFQVNLAQRLLHPATLPPLELYRRLRERNPAPFAGYLDVGDFAIASASPERFVRVEGGHVETRPIKGTRPRGATPADDAAASRALLASAKDRSENVMIIDLLRNDLGRVCAYGSVHVDAVCRLESYRTVHHLVSEVSGQLRPGLGPVDLLRAAFPGGSVTGAPKVRAMEIIAELEPTARGPYCGSLGYIGFDGTMDTNILIRTFTVGKGWIQFPVGGGIVADSTPEGEYAETLHKAEGLLRALR
jgi:para-aminobenzoate synthetase component 1